MLGSLLQVSDPCAQFVRKRTDGHRHGGPQTPASRPIPSPPESLFELPKKIAEQASAAGKPASSGAATDAPLIHARKKHRCRTNQVEIATAALGSIMRGQRPHHAAKSKARRGTHTDRENEQRRRAGIRHQNGCHRSAGSAKQRHPAPGHAFRRKGYQIAASYRQRQSADQHHY